MSLFNRKMKPVKSDFGDFETPKEPKSVKSPFKRTLINVIVTLIFGALYFYVDLPPLSLKSERFYTFILLLCLVYSVSAVITAGFKARSMKDYFRFVKRQCRIPLVVALAAVAVCLVGSLFSAEIFRAGSYKELLTVQEGNFAEEIQEVSYDKIPMLDAASAEKLGDRKLGELADMVSQFEVAEDYTQINYKGRPVRVTPLRYGDWIKWLNNRSEGLPAYLIIDMVTQNVTVERPETGVKYSKGDHFSRNLYRHLRFNYPTYIFEEPTFEIDEDGTPYWVCARIDKTIGLFGGKDIIGAVLVNALTGESEYFTAEEVPTWVDHLYSASLIIQQYDYYGKYKNGFINSILGQRDVTVTTAGYNYLASGDDVYMYTGITSVGGDESNVGFILTNQRTKETKYYPCAGAEEFSAMASAEGQVQQMQYTATFPLLLNIADQPTYFMALKDAAGLVKMYAMVNVSQYQIVATGSTVADCERNYRVMLAGSNLISPEDTEIEAVEKGSVSGRIAEIRSAVMDGDSYYFLRLEGGETYYRISASQCQTVVILNVGDEVTVSYEAGEGSILNAVAVESARVSVDSAAPETAPAEQEPSEEQTAEEQPAA
ncbi:MAG: CvpA family protein [Oscillospiraceae bacterium]